MYNAVRGSGKGIIIYFITLIVFGNIILLKLFLAVLLENFEDKRRELEEEREKQKQESTWSQFKVFVNLKINMIKVALEERSKLKLKKYIVSKFKKEDHEKKSIEEE